MIRLPFRASALLVLVAFTATGIVSAQNTGQHQRPAHHAEFQGRGDRPGHRSRRGGHRQDHHSRPARARAGHDAVADADDPDAFYEAFLALLSVHQFVAVESGGIIKIVPDANARQMPNIDLPSRVKSGSDELITQVIAVHNVNAAQLVPVLRPLMPQSAHLAAYPNGNILILSDRASNVSRMMRIIERIDQEGDNDVDIINLQHASSSEVVRVVNTFFAQQSAAEGGGGATVARHRRRPLQQRAGRRREDRCACASRR